MERKKIEELLKKMKKSSVARLAAMSESEQKRLLLTAIKDLKKVEKEQFKAMDLEMEMQLDNRKKEKLRAHFKIITGGIVLNALNGFDLDYYVNLPRPDRRRKCEQPPNPDELFVRDLCARLGLKSGLPPEKK